MTLESQQVSPAILQPFGKPMTIDEALTILEQALRPMRLNDLQQLVFRRSWVGQGYSEIAAELGYDHGYIRDVGSQLWHAASEALGEKVTKKNLQSALQRYQRQQNQPQQNHQQSGLDRNTSPWGLNQVATSQSETATSNADSIAAQLEFPIEFPSGTVPLNSRFYIERPPIEQQVLTAIGKPGSLIRIRAPKQMGKSSLMYRIVAYAKQIGLQTATLNLQRADSNIFASLDQFLRWFCANISQQLDLVPCLDQYWNPAIGSKMSCTLYFQRYLLEAIDSALVLALDEVNRIFEYPDLAGDFLPLLRSWYEDASEFEVWQKLRLVVVHATEVYIPLHLNQSPFNVGLPIKLPEFNLKQIQDLALRYGLTWAEGESGISCLKPLQALIGGHPHLVRLAIHNLAQSHLKPSHLAQPDLALENLLREAATPSGIYSEHLRSHLSHLQAHPELAVALKQVLDDEEVHLAAVIAYKLESLGLIQLRGDRVTLSRELYRIYFQEQLKNLVIR